MRRFPGRRFGPAALLAALTTLPALSQNLLMNPGFDRDLSGWTVATKSSPDAEATATWAASDAGTGAQPGGVALHARANVLSSASAYATQCVPLAGGSLVTFGAKFLTVRQYGTAAPELNVTFFPTTDCTGAASGTATTSAPWAIPPEETSSGGSWSPLSSQAVPPSGARSVRLDVGARATGYLMYGLSYVDAVADDAFLATTPATTTTWILPSAAHVPGASGSLWTTDLTLANPGTTDALVTLKFLGHDRDGRDGIEKTILVRARALVEYRDILESLFGVGTDYGAIRVSSSSASLFVQSETSTSVPGGGTVGQALPAFSDADFATALPKALAPVRENASFRTNLVLANASEQPVDAHVVLYAADGTVIGTSEVALPPLGMTQISRVAAALGTPTLDGGRLSISTPTPDGAVAAYASIIDNVANDPRTLLPQEQALTTPSTPKTSQNLLFNPGFSSDVQLLGWHVRATATGGTPVAAGIGWTPLDSSGNAASGGLSAHAYSPSGSSISLGYGQCVPVAPRSRVSFGAKYLVNRALSTASAVVGLTFYDTLDCGGADSGGGSVSWPDTSQPPWGEINSGGAWVNVASSASAPAYARSALINVGISCVGPSFPGTNYIDAVADDAFVTVTSDAHYDAILPSAAWGSWKTNMTLVNPDASDASVTLKWLGHDVDGWMGTECSFQVRGGETLRLHECLIGQPSRYGAVHMTSSAPSVFLQSETFTDGPGGSVGQALPAFRDSEFATSTPKSLAPIRENEYFRTNLVLANVTVLPGTAHVVLYAADGSVLGTRDVLLPPLGMTQLNRVAAALGAPLLATGRLAISTPTPGGAVAAYASVIDNVTNDPRTLLPR